MTATPEAERAVLGALMRRPDGKDIIRLGITSDLFSQKNTRDAFIAIAAFIADGTRPDAVLLRAALSDASLIEVETSLQEQVSAANLPAHVALLKERRTEREVQAARERLAKAAAAGAPDHELTAILESIKSAQQDVSVKNWCVDITDVCAFPPQENWLIKGYFPTDSLSVLFGDPGCGKSFLAIDLACHVATGTPWRGQPATCGTVLYIAGEGRNGLSKRFKAWFERHGETPRNIKLSLAAIALTDPASMATLVAQIKTMTPIPRMVIIDTINRNFGPGDENSTMDMTRAIAAMDSIRAATLAALIGVHHAGHGDKNRGRGSSVLRAALDAEYATEKFDNVVQVRCTKAKDFDHPPPLAWTLQKHPLPWADESGTPLDSAVLESHGMDAVVPPRRLSTTERIALDALKQALVDHGMEADGVVSVAEDQWRQACYDAGISDSDKQDTVKKAYNRARRELLVSGSVHTKNQRYWLPVRGRTNRDKSGNVPPFPPLKPGQRDRDISGHTPLGVSRSCPDVPAGEIRSASDDFTDCLRELMESGDSMETAIAKLAKLGMSAPKGAIQ